MPFIILPPIILVREEATPNINPSCELPSGGYPPHHLIIKTKIKMANETLGYTTYTRPESADAKELGTLKELIGNEGKLGLIPSNFTNASVRVMVLHQLADGRSAKFICSPRVSAGLRAKTITLNHLAGFKVAERKAKADGSIVRSISMPAEGLQWFDAININPVPYTRENVSAADYLALG